MTDFSLTETDDDASLLLHPHDDGGSRVFADDLRRARIGDRCPAPPAFGLA